MRNIARLILFIMTSQAFAGTGTQTRLPGSDVSQVMVGGETRISSVNLPVTPSEVLRGAAIQTVRIPGMLNKARTSTTEAPHRDCSEVKAQECESPTPAPRDHIQFGISFINYRARTGTQQQQSNVPDDCKCLTDKLKGDLSGPEFEAAKMRERAELNQKILKSYGKKFVNDFASNLEDMAFFLNQSKNMFNNETEAIALQCNDQAIYNSKINEVCGRRGITDTAFIQGRKDLFINAVSGGNFPFEQRLNVLGNEILGSVVAPTFDMRQTIPQTAALRFSRVNYDGTRMSLATSDPQSQFMDMLVSQLIRNPEFNQKITVAMTGNTTPVEALIKVIEDNKQSSNYFASYGISFANQARNYFADKDKIADSFKFLMQVHPGYHIMFKDKSTFEKVREHYKTDSGATLLSTINAEKNIIEPVLVQRCNTMVEEFANSVCTKDEQLISSVDPDDLELLLHAETEEKSSEPKMHELLICESKLAAVVSGAAINGLAAMYDPQADYRQSDYVGNAAAAGRAGQGVAGHTASGISALSLLLTTNPEARKQVGAMIDQNAATRTGFSGPGIVANQVYAQDVVRGRVMSLGSTSMSKEDARKVIADNQRYEEQRALARANSTTAPVASSTQTVATAEADVSPVTNTAQISPINGPQAIAPVTPSYVANQATVAANAAQASREREALRDYVANRDASGESVRAVDNMDDESVAELNRLRGEKQALLEKSLQEGNARLEEMRTRLAEVTAQTNRAPASAAVETDVSDSANEDDDSEPVSSARNPRAPEVRPGGVAQIAAAQNIRPAGGASTGGTSGSAIVNPDLSTETNAPSSSSANQSSSNAASQIAGSLVISGVKTAAPQGQELNQEVQKFLANSDLNSSAIQDIKTKGIKIRYSVMENNQLVQKEVVVKYETLDLQTRNAIDLKLARKTVSNQVSKLAVLRLIMGGNQTR